jgi:hypothetical protein
MLFPIDETCPRCRKPIKLATIEPHPSIPHTALHSFECVGCGSVMTKSVSIGPDNGQQNHRKSGSVPPLIR